MGSATSVGEALANGVTQDRIDAYLVSASSKSGIRYAKPAIKSIIPSASAEANSVIQVGAEANSGAVIQVEAGHKLLIPIKAAGKSEPKM